MPQAVQGFCCHCPGLIRVSSGSFHLLSAPGLGSAEVGGGWWGGGQLLAGLAPCAPAACGCSRHTSAPGGGVSPGWRSSWGSSGLLLQCSSFLVGLPSVSCALMGRPTHLDLGSGLGEPLMQLHFLLAHAGGCRGGLRFCRFLRDWRRRGPFQASSAGPESLQMLEFLCFTCSCVGGSSPP